MDSQVRTASGTAELAHAFLYRLHWTLFAQIQSSAQLKWYVTVAGASPHLNFG